MSAKILSLPKFVAIQNMSALTAEVDDDMADDAADFLIPGKKRRLDHLTWEEKLQRK